MDRGVEAMSAKRVLHSCPLLLWIEMDGEVDRLCSVIVGKLNLQMVRLIILRLEISITCRVDEGTQNFMLEWIDS